MHYQTLTDCLFVIQAEELGCEGKVEEAQGIMKLCDQLNEERTQMQNVRLLTVIDIYLTKDMAFLNSLKL